jgi:hypothetical protein
LYQRALRIREQALGFEDPEIADTLTMPASHYRDQGKYEEAEPLYQQALGILEHAFGLNHPRTNSTRVHYIQLLREIGRGDEANLIDAEYNDQSNTIITK